MKTILIFFALILSFSFANADQANEVSIEVNSNPVVIYAPYPALIETENEETYTELVDGPWISPTLEVRNSLDSDIQITNIKFMFSSEKTVLIERDLLFTAKAKTDNNLSLNLYTIAGKLGDYESESDLEGSNFNVIALVTGTRVDSQKEFTKTISFKTRNN